MDTYFAKELKFTTNERGRVDYLTVKYLYINILVVYRVSVFLSCDRPLA